MRATIRRQDFGAVAIAFVVGTVAGAAGLAVSSTDRLGPAFQTMVEMIKAGSSDALKAAGLENSGGTATETAPDVTAAAPTLPAPSPETLASEAQSGDVRERLALFAGKLQETLPREAGPDIADQRRDEGMTLNLGYAVGRTMPKGKSPISTPTS